VARRTEGGEAPAPPGATTENTGLYLKEEQRRAAGCIAGRMQRHFHHGLLARVALHQLRHNLSVAGRQHFLVGRQASLMISRQPARNSLTTAAGEIAHRSTSHLKRHTPASSR
jgi:hypothetical protein